VIIVLTWVAILASSAMYDLATWKDESPIIGTTLTATSCRYPFFGASFWMMSQHADAINGREWEPRYVFQAIERDARDLLKN